MTVDKPFNPTPQSPMAKVQAKPSTVVTRPLMASGTPITNKAPVTPDIGFSVRQGRS